MDISIKGTVFHWCLFVLFVIGFGVFLAPVFTGILNIGNTVGMLFFGILAAVTLFWSRFRQLMENRFFRAAVIVISSAAGVLILLALIISAFMVRAANDKPTGETTLIILGCRVKGDHPSLMLEKRINAAYEYLAENPEAVAILSGGQGSDEIMSEAECMYRELTKKGISPDRLIKEDKSTNTYENIRNSKAIIDELELSGGVVIVTSEFHQCRAQMIAGKQGIETKALSAHTALFLLPTYWIRDCLGVAYEFVF